MQYAMIYCRFGSMVPFKENSQFNIRSEKLNNLEINTIAKIGDVIRATLLTESLVQIPRVIKSLELAVKKRSISQGNSQDIISTHRQIINKAKP